MIAEPHARSTLADHVDRRQTAGPSAGARPRQTLRPGHRARRRRLRTLPGEILAVIGDNGAGKSSLIKALSGAIDAGRRRDPARRQAGQISQSRSTRARHGIETVYQDLAVAPAHEHRRKYVPRPRDATARLARLRSSG